MSVDFIMTKFMYPLDEKKRPIIFGKLYFDNPRTTEEINFIANILKQINYECAGGFPDRLGVFPENCVTLMTIYDMFYKNNCSDPVVEGFNQKYGKLKNIYKKLARMMVVIRSTDIIDIEEDILIRILNLKEEELCHHKGSGCVIDLIREENDTVIEQTGENVIGAFATVGLLYNHWHQGGFCQIFGIEHLNHTSFI